MLSDPDELVSLLLELQAANKAVAASRLTLPNTIFFHVFIPFFLPEFLFIRILCNRLQFLSSVF
ncbi:hypothetical protein STRDD11_02453 [Streptococcus sp. DD11]|nr:hypothetical protein STRDD11_02453 [Streptococcus sp. DD11]